jgi:hypothetical protein
MPNFKQIPGVELILSDSEIATIKEHFDCQTIDELSKAAERYESLLYLFAPEEHGIGSMDVRDNPMRLALALAEFFVFENFRALDVPLRFKYRKGKPGRKREYPLPPELLAKVRDLRTKGYSSNEAAVRRLVDLGLIPVRVSQTGKTPSAKSVLRYLQEAEKRQAEHLKQAREDFKNLIR